ncbi:hypothetical protein GCM10028801_30680 [Nocardioides maradonensis]
MAGIKAGSLIHVGNGSTVIDRIQTGGPGQLNIPVEKIYELGNYKSVASVRDVPDLTFSLDSLDVSTEIETLLTKAYAGRNVTDGVMSATSTGLTSATAAFTSADAGRMVIVAGAGVGGGELVTTIASVTNATTVVLANPSVAAVSAAAVRIAPNGIDLATCAPADFASQFKAGLTASNPYLVTDSVAVPFVYLESMSYRFGLRDNASQQASLRGDSIFYNPGATYIEETAGTGSTSQAVVTAHPAYQLADGDQRRVLSVSVGSKRLAFGVDYAETYGTVTAGAAVTTVTLVDAVATTDKVRIVYSSPTSLTYSQSVHADTTVKPAAVKGIDIDVYVGGYNPNDISGSQANRLRMVQAVQADWKVTLDKDEEFGNHFAVGQDFDVPDVSGSVTLKPRDAAELLSVVRKISGVTDATKVVGAQTAVPLALDIVIKHPDTGAHLKRIHVDDARFTAPGFQGQVQQKLSVELQWTSDEGGLLVFER